MKENTIKNKTIEFINSMMTSSSGTMSNIGLNKNLAIWTDKSYNVENNQNIYCVELLAIDDFKDYSIIIKKWKMEENELMNNVNNIAEQIFQISKKTSEEVI